MKLFGALLAIAGFCATSVLVSLIVGAFIRAADAMDKAFGDWPSVPPDFIRS